MAVGPFAKAFAVYATAVGPSAVASADASSAYGLNTVASGKGSIALGAFANASGGSATAIGGNAEASATSSVAVGYQSQALAANTALSPTSANTSVYSSTTLGPVTYGGFAGSGSSALGVFSIGNTTNSRRLLNVSAGLIAPISTDAINGSQLYAALSVTQTIEESLSTSTSTGFSNTNSAVASLSTSTSTGFCCGHWRISDRF